MVSALSGACASTGGVVRPFPTPGADLATDVPPPASTTAGIDQEAVVRTALELRGVPYRNGGSDMNGFDCSGFTQFVFARYGQSLPREVRDQFLVGAHVPRSALKPGDLVFFRTTARGPSHVAIATGGDEFVHAPSSTGVVRVERLDSRYWSARIVGIRRVAVP